MSEENTKHIQIALLVAGLMLCVAAIPVIPYGYYPFLRLVVCSAAAFTAFFVKKTEDLSAHFVPLLIFAILFNPFMPLFLSRALWTFLDLGTAGYFLMLAKNIQKL